MSKIEIKDIDFGLCYEGYLWMSNENKPRIFAPAAVIDRTLLEGLTYIIRSRACPSALSRPMVSRARTVS